MRQVTVLAERERYDCNSVNRPDIKGRATELANEYRTDITSDATIKIKVYDTFNRSVAGFCISPPDGHINDLQYFVIGIREDYYDSYGDAYLRSVVPHEMAHVEANMRYNVMLDEDSDIFQGVLTEFKADSKFRKP